jgi:hypothetical protein
VHHAVQVPLRIALALIPIAVERLAPRADTHITLGIVGKVLWPEQLERSTDSITHLVVKRVGLGLMFSSFGESFITLAQSPTKWLAFVMQYFATGNLSISPALGLTKNFIETTLPWPKTNPH